MTTKETTRAVKQVLVNLFKGQNAKVIARSGTGTASGWVEASITIPRPVNCECTPTSLYCQFCKTAKNSTSDIARKAIKDAKIEFYTYLGDMDNNDRDCFLLQTYFI